MAYEFDATNHVHTLDGKPLIGVTSALGVINKPMLIDWAARMATEYVRDNLKSMDDLEAVLEEAKKAHRIKKEKAGDWGTAMHKIIEDWIKDGVEPLNLDDTQGKCFSLFKDWAKDNKVEFLESEKHIYSRNLWIGGIADLVLTINGKKYLGDIKTSSGIYNEAFYQIGAYHLCLEEMGEHKDIEGYIVINLKKNGTIDFKEAVNMDINRKAFLSALSLYKIINSLE